MGWPGKGQPSSALTLVWKQKMVTEMDNTAVMITAMMTALVLYTLQGREARGISHAQMTSKLQLSGSTMPSMQPYRGCQPRGAPLPYKTHHRVLTAAEHTWQWCRSCSPWQESEGRTETKVRHLIEPVGRPW